MVLSQFRLIELDGDDLKADSAVEDEASQDNQKQNRSGERPPVILGAPWVGPPTIVHLVPSV
jgi:hypothetical protein